MASAGERCSSAVKMCGVSPRRHVGLQQLEVITASARAFLGPNRRLKLIQDEAGGAALLVRSCWRLLEHMDLDGSIPQLLQETLRAQQEHFGCGTTTLAFLAGAWSRVALECLDGGMSVTRIGSAMRRGLEECLSVCERSIRVEETFRRSSAPDVKLPPNLRLTLKHSRHFSDAQPQDSDAAQRDVSGLAHAVSHGCDAAMQLVLKAYKLQSQNGFLDIQSLVTCSIAGPSREHSDVSRGFVTLLSVSQASVVERLQGRRLNVALVIGDLSEEHRHVGFNRPSNVKHTTDRVSGVSVEECWIESVLKTLLDVSVDVVLVSGAVDGKLRERCTDVLLVEGVRRGVLKAFSSGTGAVLLSSVSELEERRVGRGVSVRREVWGAAELLRIAMENSSLLTAVITSPAPAQLQLLEDEFWSCAHRLHQALTDGTLLPGAGQTEIMCIHALRQVRCSEEERLVLELMADVWLDFISTLMLNAGAAESKAQAWTTLQKDGGHVLRDAGEVGVCDNVTVKREAWRRALDLVLLVLQSDTEITTGVAEGRDQHSQLMFL